MLHAKMSWRTFHLCKLGPHYHSCDVCLDCLTAFIIPIPVCISNSFQYTMTTRGGLNVCKERYRSSFKYQCDRLLHIFAWTWNSFSGVVGKKYWNVDKKHGLIKINHKCMSVSFSSFAILDSFQICSVVGLVARLHLNFRKSNVLSNVLALWIICLMEGD